METTSTVLSSHRRANLRPFPSFLVRMDISPQPRYRDCPFSRSDFCSSCFSSFHMTSLGLFLSCSQWSPSCCFGLEDSTAKPSSPTSSLCSVHAQHFSTSSSSSLSSSIPAGGTEQRLYLLPSAPSANSPSSPLGLWPIYSSGRGSSALHWPWPPLGMGI